MTRALGPRASATTAAAAPWTVLACCWTLIGLAVTGWAGVRAAAWLSGGTTARLDIRFFELVLSGRTSLAWQHVPAALAGGCVAVSYLAAAGAARAVWLAVHRRRRVPGDPVAALGDNPALTALTRGPVSERASRLRPGLAAPSAEDDIGLGLGGLMRPGGDGPRLYASWEDTIVAFMAPRSGKTTVLGIPYVLSAPGAVIATSNKADLWAATAALRAGTGSRVWLFDPNKITRQAQTWWWNPLLALTTVEDADRLAGHFVLTVADDKKRDLWGPAAQDLLAALFLAAAASGGSLYDVGQWLAEPAVPTPIELLTVAGFTAMATSLRGAQNGAVETRDGIYQTARTAARCLSDPDIMSWVTPSAGRPLRSFDPDQFTADRGTLYLLSKSRSAAAPLIAALTDISMRTAEQHAEREGGRLDPPLVTVLDEAANICRIADLPDLYSHLGSRGITPVTILQSYEQGVTVWGEAGMASLWGAATIKVIGAGIDSPRLTRDLATLIGQHDVPVRSVSYSDGKVTESVSLRRQDILEPAAIRALPPGSALLLATGLRPALVKLTPWYKGPRAAEITACRDDAENKIRRQAVASAREWLGAA